MTKPGPKTARQSSTPPPDQRLLRRVVIEAVLPQIDCGRFAIKRTVGDDVQVTADIHADGQDAVAAVLMFRRLGESEWSEAPMRLLDNDRWLGSFTAGSLGRYEYTVEAWIDRFSSWRHDLSKKVGAGQ